MPSPDPMARRNSSITACSSAREARWPASIAWSRSTAAAIDAPEAVHLRADDLLTPILLAQEGGRLLSHVLTVACPAHLAG